MIAVAALLAGCTLDPCDGPSAGAACSEPTMSEDHYVAWSSAYFDTLDSRVDNPEMPYSERVARWEWPPWYKLTAYTRETIEATDALLALYPSIVEDRDCRAFDTQPFGRCTVVFYYEDASHEGRGCPIYEEFSFNEAGEITFIEAWSDVPGLDPRPANDRWGELSDIGRLSTRIPGLGTPDGRIDLDSEAMAEAAAADPDVADFVVRARDWYPTWLEEVELQGDSQWERGCGWTDPSPYPE